MGNCPSDENNVNYGHVLAELQTPPSSPCLSDDFLPPPLVRTDSRKKVSNGEMHCRAAVDTCLQEKGLQVVTLEYNYRPSILRNPRTGQCLELDIYVELVGGMKFAIEFNGRQHDQYTPIFHRSEEDFILQQERDVLKKELCIQNGINLLVISHNCGERKIQSLVSDFFP